MKKILLSILIFLMLIASVLAVDIIPATKSDTDVQQVSALSRFFGGFQQTVIVSNPQIEKGQTQKFSFTDCSDFKANRIVTVFEVYNSQGQVVYSYTSKEYPMDMTCKDSGEAKYIYSTNSWTVGMDVPTGDYSIVSYMYSRDLGRQVSPSASISPFKIVEPKISASYCEQKFVNTCHNVDGIYISPCKVSATGLSCNCPVSWCSETQVCSNGACIESNKCVPKIIWNSVCQIFTDDGCGKTVSRATTDGQSCGTNMICRNENCVANCKVGNVGDFYCKGNAVAQMYLNNDCSSAEKIITNCNPDQFCEDGICKLVQIPEQQQAQEQQKAETPAEPQGTVTPVTPDQATQIQDSIGSASSPSTTTPKEQACVLDRECGVGFECKSGVCTQAVQKVDYTFAIVLGFIILVVVLLYAVNYARARPKKRRK